MTRFVAILVSICFVGLTVVPAEALPCCCKSKGCSKAAPDRVAGCHKVPTQPQSEPNPSHTKSCCAGKAAAAMHAKCASGSVDSPCPICRCLEQMQVVALTGHSAFEATDRIPLAIDFVAVDISSKALITASIGIPVTEASTLPPLLQTGTLRC